MAFLIRIRPLLILLSLSVMTTGVVRAATMPSATETKSGVDSAEQAASQPESGAAESQQNPSEEAPANPPAAKQGGSQGPVGRPFGSTRPGKYRYRHTSTNSEGEKQTRESSVTIEDGSKTQEALRQIIKPQATQEQRDSGFGDSQQEVEWRADGLFEIGYKASTPQGETGCNWEPPKLSVQLPIKVGLEWKSDSSCTATVTYQGQQQSFKNHTVTSSRVTGIQQVTIAGRAIEVFVIEERSTATTDAGNFSSSAEGTATRLYSAKHGLDVKRSGKTTSDFRGTKREFSSETELLNLDPE